MMCMRMSGRVSVCDAFVNWPEVKIKRRIKKLKRKDGLVFLLVGDQVVCCVLCCAKLPVQGQFHIYYYVKLCYFVLKRYQGRCC
ncbi:hypothetical protein VIGAN_06229100 [Vigna angularis var. angularis]|uniref:Uncharacterized protein n=1 Tax=Vigna angularis var. angularis TaxID=157739 RepID=A0A0S3SDS2_PHAAN|nr:hypothetical protein VIGAN_06229100 [Vigna angularis var. angularis]